MKDAGMRIRVEQELRDNFIAACQAVHVPAAQVLREFMRQYIANNSVGASRNVDRTLAWRQPESDGGHSHGRES